VPEPVNPSLQMPGYSAGTSQPGVAKKLVVRAQRGDGTAQATVSAANRMFRLKNGGAGEQPEARLASRDIRSAEEVTRGLGLDSRRDAQLQTLVRETRADGGAKSQTHRLFLGLDRLNTTMRSMRDIPSETRMEIARRARALWMNTQQTDYGSKEPTVRAPQRPQVRDDRSMKKSQRFVTGSETLVKKMTPTKSGKTVVAKKPAKESWSQQRERELNEAYKAKQAAAKQAKTEAKSAPKGKGAAPAAGPAAAPQAPAGAMPASQAPAAPVAAPKPAAGPAGAQAGPPAPKATQKPAAPAPKGGGEDIIGAAAARTAGPAAGPLGAPKPGKAPKGAKGPAMGGADASGAKGAVSLDTPPPGFTAIPNSKKGGYHKQQGTDWIYWYPGVGITTTAMGEDNAHGGAAQPAGAAPAGKPGAGPAAPAQGAGKPPASVLGMKTPGAAPQGAQGAGAQGGGPGSSDKEKHRGEVTKHRAAAKAAAASGDQEQAQAHFAAAEHHRHEFNRKSAGEYGQTYKNGKPAPPLPEQFAQQAEMGQSGDPIADSYGRAQSGMAQDESGERSTAADPRERHVPESETVKGMREALGKSVNVLADLSAAHDHLSALKAKRKQIAASGHPLARRLVSQIDAEVAATRHDIVQLEDAHGHAMKEVAKWQSQMRTEQIKANPIFRALMGAFQALAGMGQKLMGGGAKPGEEQPQGQPGAAEEMGEEQPDESAPEEGGDEATDEGEDEAPQGPRDQLDLASRRERALRGDDGEFDVSGLAKQHERQQALDAGASPDVLDALDAREGGDGMAQPRNGRDDKAANMQRVLAVLGEKHAPGGEAEGPSVGAPEEGEDDAASAIASLPQPDEQPMRAQKPAQAAPKDVEEDTGQWDADLAAKRKKITDAEKDEEETLAPYAGMDTMSRLKALKFGEERGTGSAKQPNPNSEKGTMQTGMRKKKKPAPAQMSEAQKSMIIDASERLVKSHAAARIMRLAPRVDALLKAASAPRFVIDRRPRADHLFALYSSRV